MSKTIAIPTAVEKKRGSKIVTHRNDTANIYFYVSLFYAVIYQFKNLTRVHFELLKYVHLVFMIRSFPDLPGIFSETF